MIKALLTSLVFLCSLQTYAKSEVKLLAQNNSSTRIQISGSDAKVLSSILDSTHNKTSLASSDLFSVINQINCQNEVCQIDILADLYEKADAEDRKDLFERKFIKKIAALEEDQVMVSAPFLGMEGGLSQKGSVDSLLTRALLEATRNHKSVTKLIVEKIPQTFVADQIVIPVFEVQLNLESVQISCYSSINVGTGLTNQLEETCALTAVARK